jgi:hypothetical protein
MKLINQRRNAMMLHIIMYIIIAAKKSRYYVSSCFLPKNITIDDLKEE